MGHFLRSDINTGVPQDCVLSPVLFASYTNDCRSTYTINYIMKYADDQCWG